MQPISIIVPIYKAEMTLVRAVRSVLAQTFSSWELILVIDDLTDYESILRSAEIKDGRIRFYSTGQSGSGSPTPRNRGLEVARFSHIAILDADDFMHPEKLERAAFHLQGHSIVSCALQLVREDLSPLRTVGAGSDRLLTSGSYKFINYSSDSMLVYDRSLIDPRFDTSLSCVTDVDLLLKLFERHDHVFHMGNPLHTYVKRRWSVTSTPGASDRIAECKRLFLERLRKGHYPLARPADVYELCTFFECALAAELMGTEAVTGGAGAIYEDQIERLVRERMLVQSRCTDQ